MKRIVVAGSRDYDDYEEASSFIDDCISGIDDSIVFVSGGCRGADALGERYANEHGFLTERYDAQWGKYGKAAGPIRNKEMAKKADMVICFWDGESRGTKSMIDFAEAFAKETYIKIVE